MRYWFCRPFVMAACCLLWNTMDEAQVRTGDSLSVEVISTARLQEIIRHDSGKVVLVNVWATWCEPCRLEMPDLLRILHKYRHQPFALILLSKDDVDQAEGPVKGMLRKIGADVRTYLIQVSDDEIFINAMNPAWSGALPGSFIYDREGRLKRMFVGKRTYRQFETAIESLLPTPTN